MKFCFKINLSIMDDKIASNFNQSINLDADDEDDKHTLKHKLQIQTDFWW